MVSFAERVDKIAQGRTLRVLYRTCAPQGRVSIISYVARGETCGRAIAAMEALFLFIRALGNIHIFLLEIDKPISPHLLSINVTFLL